MRALALQWFAQMQAGKIDRTQYTAAYSAQLTDDAVQAMSRHLNQYGASPIVAPKSCKSASIGRPDILPGEASYSRAAMRPAFCSASMRRARSPASVS